MAARRYINCTEVIRNGKKVWRARLVFPFDTDLGYKPAPVDFYGKTAAEADAKRKNYKPEKKGLDKQSSFLQYIEHEFLPKQEDLARAEFYCWQHFINRKRRLERFLLEPKDERLKNLRIRKVRLGALQPEHIKDFFHALILVGLQGEYRRKIKDDLRIALKECKKRIPEPWTEYFEEVAVPGSRNKTFSKREIFDWRAICAKILDETKPLRHRVLVAFAMHTMRRPSELFALQWKDIDWQHQRVVISKATRLTATGFKVRNRTKNEVETEVFIAPAYLRMLERLKAEALPICSECGQGQSAVQHRPPFDKSQRKRKTERHRFEAKLPGPDDFIFTTEYGKPLTRENFKRVWASMKKNLELPDGPTFYSLKHMANSAAQDMGISPSILADRMGHTSDEMARSVYRAIPQSEKQRAALVGEEMLSLAGAAPQSTPPALDTTL